MDQASGKFLDRAYEFRIRGDLPWVPCLQFSAFEQLIVARNRSEEADSSQAVDLRVVQRITGLKPVQQHRGLKPMKAQMVEQLAETRGASRRCH